MLFQILKENRIKYEDLTTAEKMELEKWEEAFQAGAVTVEKIKEYISLMIGGVENELAVYELPKEKDLLLKARLRNYLLLKAFVTAPDKAQKALQEAIKNLPRRNDD